MNAERLLVHYEQIADAPDAIARLRRFVLDLAVRGKLVAQDARDEPASELLKRIAAEKARLPKAGKITQPKSFELSIASGYQLPASWKFVALGDAINSHLGGGTPSKTNPRYWNGSIPWASVKDVGKSKYLDDTIDHITEAGLANSSSNLIPSGNLLIVTRMGLGKVSINRVPVSINQDLRALFPSRLISIDYCYNFLLTYGFAGTGLTVKGIKLEELLSIPFPLPPVDEQHRIVAKLDELMALCDQLEVARGRREALRDRLAATSFARLSAADPARLQADARFALAALSALTTRPDQIKQLRQTILNLAVRGKLVTQNPADQPTNLKSEDCGGGPEIIPSTWGYTRLINLLAEDTRNGYSRKPDDAPNGIPILRISAGTARRDGVVAEDEHKLISGIDHEARLQYGLKSSDLLACRFNGNKTFVGRLTIFRDYLGIQPIYPDKLIRIRVSPEYATPEFLRLAGDSDLVRAEVEAVCATTVGNWGISASNLKEIRFPLPPLAEQHRIVAKVDKLMTLCDQLEATLTAADTTRRRLLDALLAEALELDNGRELAAAE